MILFIFKNPYKSKQLKQKLTSRASTALQPGDSIGQTKASLSFKKQGRTEFNGNQTSNQFNALDRDATMAEAVKHMSPKGKAGGVNTVTRRIWKEKPDRTSKKSCHKSTYG